MAATRRLQKELQDIRSAGLKSFRDVQVDETNILQWQGELITTHPVYCIEWFIIRFAGAGFAAVRERRVSHRNRFPGRISV